MSYKNNWSINKAANLWGLTYKKYTEFIGILHIDRAENIKTSIKWQRLQFKQEGMKQKNKQAFGLSSVNELLKFIHIINLFLFHINCKISKLEMNLIFCEH